MDGFNILAGQGMHTSASLDRHTLDTPFRSISSGAEDGRPLVLNPPSSLVYGVPANITWTGGTSPYSLQVSFREGGIQAHEQFDSIETTHFVWTPNAPVGTRALLSLVDSLGFTIAPEPILVESIARGDNGVDEAPDPGIPNPAPPSTLRPQTTIRTQITSSLVLPISTVFSLGTPVPTASTTVTSARLFTTTFTTELPVSTLPSSSPPSIPSGVSRENVVTGGVLAAILLTVTIFLLWTFPWWRTWLFPTRKRDSRNDTEKQVAEVEGRTEDGPVSGRSTADADAQDVQTLGQSDLYPDGIFPTSPALAEPDVPQSLSSSPFKTPARAMDTISARLPRTPDVALGPRTSYMSARSDTPTRSSTMTVASSEYSGESTLPPSYRSNRSTSHIIPIPGGGYPTIPPPAYPSAAPPPPPSAFRMNLKVLESLRDGRRSLSISSGSRRGYVSLDGIDAGYVGGTDGRDAAGGRTYDTVPATEGYVRL